MSSSNVRFRSAAVIAAALLVVCGGGAVTLTGCGGSSAPAASGWPLATEPLRSVGEASADAQELAARETGAIPLPLDRLARIDRELAYLREKQPAVAGIHAKRSFVGQQVIVGVDPTAPFRAAWDRGDTATGEPDLDAVLTRYKASSVTRVSVTGDRAYYTLGFAEPVNAAPLAAALDDASENIVGADPNGIAGDGDDITRAEPGGGVVVYTFSRGWGDCPAGCINRRFYAVTLNPDGTTSMSESGDELPVSATPG